jgi:hypothetical protein
MLVLVIMNTTRQGRIVEIISNDLHYYTNLVD